MKKEMEELIRINHGQGMIIKMLENGMATPKQIAQKLGREYNEFKAQSMVLTLARKGLIDKTKAALILRGTKMVKFLDIPVEGSGLKKPIPQPIRR